MLVKAKQRFYFLFVFFFLCIHRFFVDTVFSSYSLSALASYIIGSSVVSISFTKMSPKNQTWDFLLVCWW